MCSLQGLDWDLTVTSRKKPSLVAEGPRYGYKMASGTFIAKSNFVLKVAWIAKLNFFKFISKNHKYFSN